MAMTKIKNIIFDLGGLFIDVYMQRFPGLIAEKLGASGLNALQELQRQGVFDSYEVGGISTSAFLAQIQQVLNPTFSPDFYAEAWNAILGQVQLSQLELAQPLRNDYHVVLLSNTNDLHVDALEQEFTSRYPGARLDDFFDQVYYSQRIGKRKPNRDAFAYVLQQHGFSAGETVFIDDSPGHLLGAQAEGIHTLLHPSNAPLDETISKIKGMLR
jgi:glucose-1-phosphatase